MRGQWRHGKSSVDGVRFSLTSKEKGHRFATMPYYKTKKPSPKRHGVERMDVDEEQHAPFRGFGQATPRTHCPVPDKRTGTPTTPGSGHSAKASCICQRPPCGLKCSSCGEVTIGRYRRQCSVHPNVAYLMDLDNCPCCKSAKISEVNGTTTK